MFFTDHWRRVAPLAPMVRILTWSEFLTLAPMAPMVGAKVGAIGANLGAIGANVGANVQNSNMVKISNIGASGAKIGAIGAAWRHWRQWPLALLAPRLAPSGAYDR